MFFPKKKHLIRKEINHNIITISKWEEKNMSSKSTQAMVIAMIAGILLLIAGVSGAATWQAIRDFVASQFPGNEFLDIVFVILIFIASLGGIAVIIGGILIGKNKIGIGRTFILLGAGMGIIGLIFSIIIAYNEGNLTIGSFLSIGMIGIILSIAARIIAKKAHGV